MRPVENSPDAQSGDTESGDKFTISEAHMASGDEEPGKLITGQGEDEPDNENRIGAGEQSTDFGSDGERDRLVKIAEIEQRFLNATRGRLRARTWKMYILWFRRFAQKCSLELYTKRQLAGKLGKQLILEYLQHIPRPSWKYALSGLRLVWEAGIGLPWPINNKIDIGKLPKVRREPTPADSIVKEWADALSRERDPYLRLIWLLIAQFGWRPSHATGIRWGDVKYGEDGKPCAIVAYGNQGEFKTYAPVAVRLPTDVATAIEELKKIHPAPYPENWLLPWRSTKGQIEPNRRMAWDQFSIWWKRLWKKYNLPPLRPKDLRHWVSTVSRKTGLSKVATAYMQGHDATDGGAMRDWYDNPRLEEIFEEQELCLPRGALGYLMPIEAELQSKIPSEALALLENYLSGTLGTWEFMHEIEEVRKKIAVRPSV